MKTNTEKMDPDGEWVDTMKMCAVHAPTGIELKLDMIVVCASCMDMCSRVYYVCR